jgi:GDP-4-dehydro-6-deoxy-D-mannose reductase
MAPAELRVGNIEVRRDFSDVRDVVRAYAALVGRGRPGEAYNVGSGHCISLKEVVETLTAFCSRPIQVTVDAHRIRSHDAKELYVSTKKITADTGWIPQYDLRTTLCDLYDYWISVIKSGQSAAPRGKWKVP